MIVVPPPKESIDWESDAPMPVWCKNTENHLYLINPLQCDGETLFSHKGHKYAIVSKINEHRTDYLCKYDATDPNDEGTLGTTTLVGKFCKPFPSFIAGKSAQSINKRFNEWYAAGFRHSTPWPDKYDRHVNVDTFAKLEAVLRSRLPTIAHAFEDRLDDPVFVRPPDTTDDDDDATIEQRRDKVRGWIALENKTPVDFIEWFGVEYERFMALPPHYTSRDVDLDWSRFGTQFHHAVEMELNGEAPLDREGRDSVRGTVEWGYFENFMRVQRNLKRRPFRTELSLSLPDLRLCGQLDALYRDDDGKFWLYDWKTVDKIADVPELDDDAMSQNYFAPPWDDILETKRFGFFMQLNVYAHMLRERCGIDVEDRIRVYVFHRSRGHFIEVVVPDFRLSDCYRIPFEKMFSNRCKEVENGLKAFVDRGPYVPKPKQRRCRKIDRVVGPVVSKRVFVTEDEWDVECGFGAKAPPVVPQKIERIVPNKKKQTSAPKRENALELFHNKLIDENKKEAEREQDEVDELWNSV